MKKKFFVAFSLLTVLLSSCSSGGANNKPKDGETLFLNNFETMQDIYRLNSMFVQYNTRGKVDINKDKQFITSGEGSMHLKTTAGSSFEFMQYFETASGGKVDIESMSKIDFDVYNASSYDSKCVLNLYCDDTAVSLLSLSTDLPKKTENSNFVHITFNLSKIAIQYNINRIRGIAFKVATYNEGEFYFDNLLLTYGSELSSEDKLYNDTINKLVAIVDELKTEPTPDDEPKIREANELFKSLPILYRNIIPNIDKFNLINENFATLVKPILINFDKNILTPCEEFYGYTYFSNIDSNSNLSFYYDTNHKFSGENGCTEAHFNGSTYSGMTLKGILDNDVEKFDYIQFTLRFETNDNRGISIWLNGSNRYILYPNVDTVYTISTKIFSSNTVNLLLHQQGINSNNDLVDPILSSSGSLFMSNFIAYGRSLATLKDDALKAIAKLPDNSQITTEESIIKYLPIIRECESYLNNSELMALYPDLFSNEQKNNITACAKKVENYNLVFGTSEKTNIYSYWYYGVPFESKVVDNDIFGSVFENTVINNTKEQKEQYFRISGITDNPTGYVENFFYIYNPTDYDFVCAVKDTDWYNFTLAEKIKVPSKQWTKVKFDPEVFTYSTSKDIAIGINVEGTAEKSPVPVGGINGKWLISSIFGYDKLTGEKVNKEIDLLPDVSILKDEKACVRYATQIRETYKKFGYLSSSEQNKVTRENYTKLMELYDAVAPYSDLYSGLCEKGYDFPFEGTINKVINGEVGGAYEIYVENKATVGTFTGIQLLFQSSNSKPKSGTSSGFFYVYNPTDTAFDGSFYPDNWGTLVPITLPAKSWTRISFDATKFGEKVSLLMIQGDIPSESTWIVSYFYSY